MNCRMEKRSVANCDASSVAFLSFGENIKKRWDFMACVMALSVYDGYEVLQKNENERIMTFRCLPPCPQRLPQEPEALIACLV